MKTIAQLQSAADVIRTIGQKISSLTATAQAKIQEIQNDATRTQLWKVQQIKPIRDAFMEMVLERWKELLARYDELDSERDYWSIPMMVMSRYPTAGYALGSPEDAAVRAQIMAEMKHTPLGLLRLEAKSAARERNWARLYLVLLVLQEREDRLPVNLSSLPIDTMEQAEYAFYTADVAKCTAELDLFALRGQVNATKQIALGFINMRFEDAKKARASQKELLWDEQVKQTQDEKEAEFEASIGINIGTNPMKTY